MIRIPLNYTAGASLVIVVRRDSDSLFLDAADGQFRVTPATPTRALTSLTTLAGVTVSGLYEIVLATPANLWPNDDYYLYVFDIGTTPANQLVSIFQVSISAGSSTLMRADMIVAADPTYPVASGTAQAGGTAGQFTASGAGLSTATGAYVSTPPQWLKFNTGLNATQRRPIQSYSGGATPTIILASAFGTAPAAGDTFVIG